MAGTVGVATSLDEKIMLAIVRASERFKRKSSAIFASYGISFSQYNVLRVLEALPGGQGSITEVSSRLLVSTPNLSGIAKRLEKTGFILRRRDPADERKTILELQPDGRQVLAEIRELQEANIKSFTAACPPPQKTEFLASLKKMLEPWD
ncbi:MAG: MarR family transcriptional regulator [Deltaproteobacteria bacterium]|nr:MarR family transcriptional regulator [Deltaproteobacteria bacterium]